MRLEFPTLSAGIAGVAALAVLSPAVLVSKLDHLAIFGLASLGGQVLLRALCDRFGWDSGWIDKANLGTLAVLASLSEWLQPAIGTVLPFLGGAFQPAGILADLAGGLLGMWAGKKLYEKLKELSCAIRLLNGWSGVTVHFAMPRRGRS